MNEICDLAEKYNALVMVDDSHAAGFIGKTGRGSAEHHHCMDRVDIFTGTLGKALGGAMGGYTTGKKEIIVNVQDLTCSPTPCLRQSAVHLSPCSTCCQRVPN